MTDKIEKMTDDDFKKIMQSLGMPDSVSLYSALKQVENHTWQAAHAAALPPGFVAVPVEPTPKMQAEAWAGIEAAGCLGMNYNEAARKVWAAMLAAAPKKEPRHD